MKRITLFVLVLSLGFTLASCQSSQVKKEAVHIDAILDGLKDSVAFMTLEYGSWPPVLKFYPAVDGHLDLFLPVDNPYFVTIRSADYADYIGFPAIAGEEVVLRGRFGDYQMSGSRFYREYALVADEEENALDYILAHPKSEVSMALLYGLEPEQMETAINAIDPKVRNGRLKPIADALLRQAQKDLIGKEVVEGAMAPDFTLPDLKGKPLTLSTLRGKWIILDFWGSWCGWCLKDFSKMKAYYEKYAGKFEIVGIDCRDTEEEWKDAVEKYALPWLHVYNSKEDDIARIYGIPGYPTKIVIDPEGKINKIMVGESEEFYEYADQLFGQS